MAPKAGHLLFAYGTLMSGAGGKLGRAQRDRLAREARVIGPACCHGRLYDLGRYPGLVLSDEPGDVVHGELVELADARMSLAWLDAYEGIVPGGHSHNPYHRQERPVWLGFPPGEAATALTAFAYVYAKDVAGLPLIADGCWRADPRAK